MASVKAAASRAAASPLAICASRSVKVKKAGSGMPGRTSRSSERNRFKHLRALCTPLWRSGGVASAPWAISSSAKATRRNASLIGIAGSRR
jgi:hypothetical protein